MIKKVTANAERDYISTVGVAGSNPACLETDSSSAW